MAWTRLCTYKCYPGRQREQQPAVARSIHPLLLTCMSRVYVCICGVCMLYKKKRRCQWRWSSKAKIWGWWDSWTAKMTYGRQGEGTENTLDLRYRPSAFGFGQIWCARVPGTPCTPREHVVGLGGGRIRITYALRLMRSHFGVSAGLGVRHGHAHRSWTMHAGHAAHGGKKIQKDQKAAEKTMIAQALDVQMWVCPTRLGGHGTVTCTAANRQGCVSACGCEVWRAPR